MRVARIEASNFASYTTAQFDFPETGVVLVTGPNGSGKSSIADAVEFTIWGRAAVPLRVGQSECNVSVHTHDGQTIRRRIGTKIKTKLTIDGHPEFETMTAGRDYIEQLIGISHRQWDNACNFSADRCIGFCALTERERRELVESLTGNFKEIESAHYRLKCVAENLSDRLYAAKNAESETFGRAASIQVANDALKKLKKSALQDATAAFHMAYLGESMLVTDLRDWKRDIMDLSDKINEVPRERCGKCGSPVYSETSRGDIDRMRNEASKLEQYSSRLFSMTRQLRSAQQEASRVQFKASAQVDDASLDAATDAFFDASHKAAEIAKAAAAHKAALDALAPAGIRQYLTSQATKIIANATNAYLRVIFPGVEIHTGHESASANDIDITLSGTPTGVPLYKALSRGQRRRVDIATMFAMAQFFPKSTLFLDEIADGIDKTAMHSLAELIVTEAQSRCIVVATHNPNLTTLLDHHVAHKITFPL